MRISKGLSITTVGIVGLSLTDPASSQIVLGNRLIFLEIKNILLIDRFAVSSTQTIVSFSTKTLIISLVLVK